MSCNRPYPDGPSHGDGDVFVERLVEMPAPPSEVWDALPALFDGDCDRVVVVDEAVAPSRFAFFWMPETTDDAPSYVVINLEPAAGGTLLHVRETRLDGSHLERSAFRACAFA